MGEAFILESSAGGGVLREFTREVVVGMALMEYKTPVLEALHDILSPSYPEISLDTSDSNRPENRLVLPFLGGDKFQFYFSNKVDNKAFRCAFALDMDQKEVPRRADYNKCLKSRMDTVSEIYGTSVYTRESDAALIKNHRRWMKLHKHRWYSIYLMQTCSDIRSVSPGDVALELAPTIDFFVCRTRKLISLIPLP